MSVATTSWKYEPFDSCAWKRNEAMTVLPAAESEVAEHRTDVLILVITTKLLEPDHRLGQLAVVTFLTWHIDSFRLCHHF